MTLQEEERERQAFRNLCDSFNDGGVHWDSTDWPLIDPPEGQHPRPTRASIPSKARPEEYTCHSCKHMLAAGVPVVVMGSHSDNEYGPSIYCLPCIERASGLLIPEDT
jgi:hypothetical protein